TGGGPFRGTLAPMGEEVVTNDTEDGQGEQGSRDGVHPRGGAAATTAWTWLGRRRWFFLLRLFHRLHLNLWWRRWGGVRAGGWCRRRGGSRLRVIRAEVEDVLPAQDFETDGNDEALVAVGDHRQFAGQRLAGPIGHRRHAHADGDGPAGELRPAHLQPGDVAG